MKPLKNWDNLANGFLFKQIYPLGWGSLSGKPHLGLDKIASIGTPIYMPFTGKVVSSLGSESGNMATIYPTGKNIVIRLMHGNQAFKSGNFNEGDVIGYVGTTGASTAPHLHTDISKGSVNINNINNFLDPATFDWGKGDTTMLSSSWEKRLMEHDVEIFGEDGHYPESFKGKTESRLEKLEKNTGLAITDEQILNVLKKSLNK